MSYQEVYEKWLNSPVLDEEAKAELRGIGEEEKKDRFDSYLKFGTAGLRGLLGIGSRRMNIYTVRLATQAIANVILNEGDAARERGVAVAYDCRIMSREFAEEVCSVFAANKIKSFCFNSLRPTPELSFAVRELSCFAGINITASHNPKEYNGYKVYWSDGAQIEEKQADAILSFMNSLDIFEDVKIADAKTTANYKTELGEDFDDKYLEKVLAQRINAEVINEEKDMKIVYTPFHGTGYRLVPEILRRAGFENVICVEEQMIPDGRFPTVKSPNPENKKSFEMAIKLAEKTGSELVIGTDPDADRVGVCVRDDKGEFVPLTGNQTGAILLEYLINARRHNGTLPKNACVVKTIVTSELGTRICEKNGVSIMNVLTGFKFIGEKMEMFEKTGEYTYLFGYEESYGCLIGDYARDKDAVVASMMICETAAFYAKQGKTLWNALEEIFKKYGYHSESVFNISMAGVGALEKMQKFMKNLREHPAEKIGGIQVGEVLDFSEGIWGLPKSNVLYYRLVENSVVVVRPSGTEPKIKVYFMTNGKTREEAESRVEALRKDFCKQID